MEAGSRRQKAPLWPPFKHGAYHNLSSTEDLPLQDTPHLSTPGTGMSAVQRTLLTPKLSPSPYNTPGLDSNQSTPFVGASPESLKYDSERPRKKWFGYGWRGGARIAFVSTVVVLMVNIVLMVYLTVNYPRMDGFPVIYRGTCENAERQNTYWHFAINVLSTGLLGASNYCMQLLCAPTRAQLDRAHAGGNWLDIGIPSIRNLRFINWKRRGFWLALCLSSIPLHLVYNSTFYAAIATNDYNVLYATEDFVNGGTYDKVQFPDSAAQNISEFQLLAPLWKPLNNSGCIQEYAHDFVTRYRNVILILSNVSTEADNSLLQIAINELPPRGHLDKTYDSFAWICNDTETSNKTGVTDRNSVGFVPCAAQAPALEDMANTWWKSGGYHISRCVAEEINPPDCHLHFAPHLMGPVILMNLVKCIVAFYVAFRMADKPLVTLGDAIESFLKYPDPATQGMCLLTAKQAEKTFSKNAYNLEPAPQQYRPHRHRWYQAATKRQWLLICGLMAFMIVGLLLGIVFGTRELAPPTLANAWSIGLGEVQTQNLVLGANLPQLGASAVLITALIANAPQAMLSFLYMVYNTIYTLMYVGEDWDMFGAYTATTRQNFRIHSKKETHRYLRVSEPKGQQKSTHKLTLPLRFAIPLLCASGLLHWLMSQSLYLANISVIPRDGTLPKQDEITTIAFAPRAMILLIALAVGMIVVIVATGLRRFNGEIPIVASNSAAISAACHVDDSLSEHRRREMVLRKVAWGVLSVSSNSGHAAQLHEPEGLGIEPRQGRKIGDTHVYSTSDFSHTLDHDDGLGDEEGYQALRGRAELVDERGLGKSSGLDIGHCSFSDEFVFKLEPGKLYA
ncbi:hypothetical protein LTR05_005189 [Lithohypha guttulata]|uniref:DUF6536 domain-containing protein n=1 Tax=Lithohypha guttulata TaxID=1690604 RepID=A0AAN7T152_9EURO|nr:hypothetical protein LTR05_005189 [Lithohypha guttulata]